ncbi:MAG TPA: hypothetical protein VN366_01245 [Feifaniaceae bacterium]|nr:hypothetical protein [Feifaniaceae bacterium]
MELPKRKKIRLKGYDYSQNGAYFITVCVKDGYEMLGKVAVGRAAPGIQLSEYGMIVHKEIEETPLYYQGVMIDKFVVMPNHIHMIVAINRENGAPGATCIENGAPRAMCIDNGAPRATRPTVSTVITALKKKVNKMIGFSIWQTSYHDHIIRSEREYQKIWEYIDMNPLKWDEDSFYSGPVK